MISRNGSRFSSFTDLCAGIEFSLRVRHAVLDGEIACLDEYGCSQFNQPLFRRGTPRFPRAFDLLYLNGKDLRDRRLIERKWELRRIVPDGSPFLMFVDHMPTEGERVFNRASDGDLEGIVAKHKLSRYVVAKDNPAWIKIKNRRYSQLIGRDELFERSYEEGEHPRLAGMFATAQPLRLRGYNSQASGGSKVCRSHFLSRTVNGMAFRCGFAPTATSSNPWKNMGGRSEMTFAPASKSGSSKVGAIAASRHSLRPLK